ncbi:MAG TPA: spermidine/putrescine ABC transporter substrate-binding protein [Clostridiaceae bacterium]
MMKKILKFVSLMLIAILTLVGCNSKSSTKGSGDKVLNIFTWANYVPDSVVKEYEKKTGIKVNYANFSTNEEMLSKLQAVKGGEYDVVICADYIIQVMAKDKNVLMAPINKDNIPNFKNEDPAYLDQSFDKGNKYSVPYTLGSQMIVYNPDKVKKEVTSYADLWDSSFKSSLVLIDDPRSIIGVALRKLGYGINETDAAKLDKAKEELKKLKPNVKLFNADTPQDSLISGDATAGIMWGSQASAAVKGNPKLKIVYPSEGTTVEEDNFIIPIKAPHMKNAENFINFMLEGKISNETTTTTEYINTTTTAKPFMSQEYLNNKAVFIPAEDLIKAMHILDIGDTAKTYDSIWSEFKQQ